MNFRTMSIAPLVLCAPLLFAQQGTQPTQNQTQQTQDHGHRGAGGGRPGEAGPEQDRRGDEREQVGDERMDLDELGLPQGQFWLNPEIVAHAGITPDQVHRLAETYLQGTLKLIQLDANLQMEQARLEPMMAAPALDGAVTLAQLDRIADAKAAIDKADARLAFGLRAVLTADQLGKLRVGNPHRHYGEHGQGERQG